MGMTLTQWMKDNDYTEDKLADGMGYTRITIKKYLHSGKPIPASFAVNVEKFTNGAIRAVELLARMEERKKITEQRLKLLRARVDI